jgi:hypothetical protein
MSKESGKELNNLVLASSLASIATAVYLYTRGHHDTGIFVGLWAPTILGLGSLANANRAAEAAVTNNA